MRHDRQQLRAGKSFQLQAESEADGKAGGGHGDPYRMPQRPRELHVRAPWHEPRKRRQMFNSYPFMLEWLKELGRLAERVTDVLDKVRFPTACPTGQGTVKTGRTSHDRESEIHLPRDK